MQPRWLTWLFLAALGYMVYTAGQQHRAPSVVTPVEPQAAETQTPAETTAALAEFTDVEGWKRKLDPDYAATHDCSKPAAKKGALGIKIIEEKVGEGEGAHCGETITVALTLWGADGNKSYHGEVPLALGSRELAAGLDYGLLGVKPGGVRTLVLGPSAFARNAKTKPPADALKAFAGKKMAVITAQRVK